tara:strand:+ start:6461 stop:7045 length:585 start_codon:yes stop_codon:yes gene_type:complete
MKNIFKHNFQISRADRQRKNKHKSFLIWFTGLSGSGKSTLANLLEIELFGLGVSTYILDGDNIRQGLNKDLNFTKESRKENIRRIGEVAKLMIDSGTVTLATFISPYKKDREIVKKLVGSSNFIEIFVNTSLKECERRDVKGLYKKAREGKIENMTGITSLYEPPTKPDLEIITDNEDVNDSLKKTIKLIKTRL